MTDDSLDDRSRGAEEPAPDRPRSSPKVSAVVTVRPDRVVPPGGCACCGEEAPRTLRETRWDGGSLLVPYCSECHGHASREETRLLATTLASMLLAATLVAGLPLLLQPPSALVHALVVLAFAFAPAVAVSLRRRPPADGHATVGRAAFFRWDGALVCRSTAWGERLAGASGALATRSVVRDPALSRWGVPALLLITLGAVPLHRFHFPEVRVVNLTPTRLSLFVDGRFRASVTPTSAESPSAGVVIRIPAGRRQLRVIDPAGSVVDTATVVVRGGEPHLYAPASFETCFWVETIGYGRSSRTDPPPNEPLGGEPRFWSLPGGVDFWFSPPPSPEKDDRSTGGLLRALRQAPCDQAPPGALRHPGPRDLR